MATPYETIYQYCQDDIRRGDLAEVIQRRIQRTLLTLHRKDMWKADLIEQIYVFATPNTAVPVSQVTGADSLFMTSMNTVANALYIQQVQLSFLTRYRFLMYCRKWQTIDRFGVQIQDPQNGQLGTVANGDFIERSPDRMFDGYGGDSNDVMYRSGDFINLRSSTPLSQVYLGYFADPIIEPVTLINSWIAIGYQNLIAAIVKQRIFADIGKTEESNAAKEEVASGTLELYANNVRLAMA